MDPEFGVESPAFVAIRAVISICTVGLIGTLALRWAVLPRYVGADVVRLRAAAQERLPRWVAAIGFVAVFASLARLLAQHAAVFGTADAWSRDSFATLLAHSHWGRNWWLALVAALAVTSVAPRLRRDTPLAWFFASGATLAFAISAPLSGHPAAAESPLLAIATQLLHLLGAGGWVGSLAVLTLVAIPAARDLGLDATEDVDARIAGLVRAFSPTALGFAALLGVSGVLIAWQNLGGITALWQSVYGRTLLLKLAVLAVVAGTGAYNWRRVLPTLGEPVASTRLRRSALIELAAAFVVLVITAVLVASPMPGE